MQIIDEKVDKSIIEQNIRISDYYDPNTFLMFDIETTGLSAANSFIYLIGMNHYKDGDWHITLLFNDDGISETEILLYFMDFIKDYKVLAHFNGDNFDIPFVKKRIDFLNRSGSEVIVDNFHLLKSVDILKLVRPYKKALGLVNIKQKTLERFLGINRIDMYDGGQMIGVYKNYLALKGMEKSSGIIDKRTDEMKSLFIQHNRDDMEGMFHLSRFFAIKAMSYGENEGIGCSIEKTDDGSLCFVFNIKLRSEMNELPDIKSEIKNSSGDIFELILRFSEGCAFLKIPVYIGTLRYYYSGSKKSYSEKSGFYIIQPKKQILAAYKETPKDKISYLLLDDTFLGNSKTVEEYYKEMIYQIMCWK